jgi:hypothetical protein
VCNSKDEDSLTLYAIQKQEKEAWHHNTPQTAADATAAFGKLDEPNRRTLHKVEEVDAKVFCLSLEVLRGGDQLRLGFGMERGSSPDGGACLAKHLISRDTSDLARKKVVESMLCLLEPQPLAIRIGVVVEARNQPFSEASTCFRRQLQNLGFESANGVSHQVNLITGRASVPRPTPRHSVPLEPPALARSMIPQIASHPRFSRRETAATAASCSQSITSRSNNIVYGSPAWPTVRESARFRAPRRRPAGRPSPSPPSTHTIPGRALYLLSGAGAWTQLAGCINAPTAASTISATAKSKHRRVRRRVIGHLEVKNDARPPASAAMPAAP